MSENKIATKADLQRMYNTILPYLGGMPEMVANKFSKGDLYSTEEKMVGQWIDGKPIYQKTFTFSDITIGSSMVTVGDLSAINIGDYININEVVAIDTSDNSISLGVMLCWYKKSTNNFGIKNPNTSSATYKNLYITIQYTKTTDSSISIGSDTDYSTEEKIVGTWIDGKPLYQRTVTGTTPSNNTQVEYQTGWTNIETIFMVNGYVNNIYNNNTAINNSDIYCNIGNNGTRYYIGCNGDWMYNRPFVITFNYTKTTD